MNGLRRFRDNEITPLHRIEFSIGNKSKPLSEMPDFSLYCCKRRGEKLEQQDGVVKACA